MPKNNKDKSMKKNRNPMILVCAVLFVASITGIVMFGGDRSVAAYAGMSLLPLLFLVGTVHFWRKSE